MFGVWCWFILYKIYVIDSGQWIRVRGFGFWVPGTKEKQEQETNRQIILYTIWRRGMLNHHHEESNTSLWLEDEEKFAEGVTITITSQVRVR